MGTFWQDIRFSFRMLMRNRGVTVLAVLALAIGIGANSALFTVIHNVLLSPLPFPNPEEIVMVNCTIRGHNTGTSGPDYLDWREQNRVFSDLCLVDNAKFNLTGTDEPVALKGWHVTTNFYDMLGIQPFLGRGFLPEEAISGNHRVAVLGYRLWENLFGADADLIGKEITLDGESFTVIGIAPANQGFIESMAQIIVPLAEDELSRYQRHTQIYQAFGRLEPGITIQQAQADMETIAARLEEEYVHSNKDKTMELIPLHEVVVQDVRTAFLVLYGAVCFVLLIACVNVANLLLAKSGARAKEMAIRSALGASRLRIVRQVLTESVILASVGGLLGLLLAAWGLDILLFLLPMGSRNVPLSDLISINPAVLGFTFLLSILAGFLFGMAPALHGSKPNVNETLKEGSRSSTSSASRHRILNLLVVSELALALILFVGAGLLIKSFNNLQKVRPGFDPDRLIAVELELPQQPQYKEEYQRVGFFEKVVEGIRSLPGVESAAATNNHPITGGYGNSFVIEAKPLPPGVRHVARYSWVTPGYFRVLGIPLLKGRSLTADDGRSGRPVVVVNESFVRKFFPDEDPIGQRIVIARAEPREIVGIVGNVKASSDNLNMVPYPAKMYEPMRQYFAWNAMTVLVRTESDPMALTNAIRQEIWNIDPNMPIAGIQLMNDTIGDSVAIQRFCAILLCVMAGVALLLAMIGVYGVMAYSVNQRTHEIGIRIALGARMIDILALVLKKGVVLSGAGVILGLAGSFALSRFMTFMLYEISATDPLIYIVIPLVLFTVAMLASYIPARKAAKVDPMISLRYE